MRILELNNFFYTLFSILRKFYLCSGDGGESIGIKTKFTLWPREDEGLYNDFNQKPVYSFIILYLCGLESRKNWNNNTAKHP